MISGRQAEAIMFLFDRKRADAFKLYRHSRELRIAARGKALRHVKGLLGEPDRIVPMPGTRLAPSVRPAIMVYKIGRQKP